MAYYGNEPADVALKVGSGVITATEIQDASISTADISNDAITPAQLDDDGTGFQIGSLGIGAAVTGSNKLHVEGPAHFTGNITGTIGTASQTNITSVGTIGTGVWNGTKVASAYLDDDTAHLSGSTFTGDVYVSASGSPSFRVTDTTNTVTGKFQADDSVGKVGTHTDHAFQIFSDNTTAITIDTSQKVGIRESSPSAAFHVVHGSGITLPTLEPTARNLAIFEGDQSENYISIASPNTSYAGINFTDTGHKAAGWVQYKHESTATNDYMRFAVNESERLRIAANGVLTLTGAGAYTAKHRIAHGTENYYWDIGYSDATLGNKLQFVNRDGGSESLRMLITHDGKVGIGNAFSSSPANVLTVQDSGSSGLVKIYAETGTVSNGENILEIRTNDTSSPSSYNLLSANVNGYNKFSVNGDGEMTVVGNVMLGTQRNLYFDGGSNTYIKEDNDDKLYFYTGGNNTMTIGDHLELTGNLDSAGTVMGDHFHSQSASCNGSQTISFTVGNGDMGIWMAQSSGGNNASMYWGVYFSVSGNSNVIASQVSSHANGNNTGIGVTVGTTDTTITFTASSGAGASARIISMGW